MADGDEDLQSWFGDLSFKVKRKLAGKIKEEADRLAAAIQDAAPVLSGKLRDSVKVRRKRNDLDLEVTAGGEDTTKEVTKGSGVDYDYALATEFGTTNEDAQPFFYPTYRSMQEDIRQNIADAVAEAINS
jgi:HK97 gp10 family phage protein